MLVKAEFPEKVLPGIFEHHRYKSLRGGRGSAKSWSVADALLIKGTQQPLRILCARETQKSIRDSVHKLLIDQMMRLHLHGEYVPHHIEITGRNGTKFAFTGLSDLTAEAIKSFEGFDIVWIEEAQVVSERSWKILTPTIRKPGSEIWATWNPELDTDPTWKRLVESPAPDTWSVELNWRDNPWFTDVLEAERQHALRTMTKVDYENIWEGKPRPTVAGAIYADEIAAMHADRRISTVPHDPYHLVYPVADIGWNDATAIGLWQRHLSQLRCIGYIEGSNRTWDDYSRELRENRRYNFGAFFLPHDGGSATMRSNGGSDATVLEGLGWTVRVLERKDPEQGIRDTRMAMRKMALDKEKCERLLECLKRYRRVVPHTTGEPGAPLHDEWSHGADMVRYAVQAAPQMDDETGLNLPELPYPKVIPV